MSAFARWGFFIARRRRAVLVASALAVIAGLALVPVFQSRLLGVGYDTPGSESERAVELIRERTGFSERSLLVVSSDQVTVRDAAFRRAVDAAVRAIREAAPRVEVLAPGTAGGGQLSPDGRAAYAIVALPGDAADRQDTSERLQEAVDRAVPAGVEADLTGNSPLLADLIRVEERDLVRAEAVGLPIALAILLVALGSVVAAGLPMALALAGLVVTFGLLAIGSFVTSFNVFVENIVAMVGLGVGIDYALLVVRRFREERDGDPAAALARTMATAGRTITFSGAILAVSLLPLAVTGMPIFSELAVASIAVVAVMVIGAMTLLPATLMALGDRLDRLSLPRRRRPRGGAWERWARAVMRRPWPVLVAALTVLILAALPAFGLRIGIDLGARAMPDEPSVRALAVLEEHFPAASLAPVEVVVTAEAETLGAARRAAESVIRSEPLLADVRTTSLGPDAALLAATPRVPVDSDEATALVRRLRRDLGAALPAGAEPLIGGVTAETVDYTDETNAKTPAVVALALALSFLLLLWVFRSPVLAVKAIVANLLSIGAAFGLTVLVFQEGLGEGLLDFTSPGYLQAFMPLTLFMLLFGLSMDYEVFMITRMREEWERTGDTVEAVARGLERTGGVVTSAAAIMVAVFGSFVLTTIPEIKQTGFGLAAAVLIDATVVRAALVPAFMRIAGRWNWWMPARLDRLLPTFEH